MQQKRPFWSPMFIKNGSKIVDSLHGTIITDSSEGDLYSDTVYLNAVNEEEEKQ